ncbi:orotate phosphoribosyltransferase [Amphibacillus marinus]|uniref:Orotate phosphoribosyltransferase n=1 Tax=Amphibacillus marinus TaxID=872970 RepID=A0A1H8I001_9BACI|nr:orotate phosphoribosyltransferase [Amphibacillus marinus]SEN61692.1 orotate phosphoribosyltransferase [Amphibacillus marinus]
MTNLAKQIVRSLYEIKAVQIKTDRSFVWTSGIHSPIYCDNRLTMSYPHVRQLITNGFQDVLADANIDVIAGCATAGIPHAAWLANARDLPMAYVRAKAKAHGKGNQIEGVIKPGDKVVVIEDLISTGGSVLETVQAIEAAGAKVVNVLAIFSYGLKKAKAAFESKHVPYQTLANFDQLVAHLIGEQKITESEGTELIEWRDQLG